MDVDFSNTDSSAATGSTNPSSATGGVIFDQTNLFGNTNSNQSVTWDFGNSSYGNGAGS